MSSAQPRKHPKSLQAEQSIGRAQSNPSTANIVTAIADSHAGLSAEIAEVKEDVRVLKDDVRVLKDDVRILKDDVSTLKGDMRTVKGDVRKLLDHFGLISGDTP